MASTLNSSVLSGSDLLFDFSCCSCQGKDINKEAEFNCDECSKCFCGECVKHHNLLFNKHVTSGKENISQWRVEHCQEHKNEKLKVFCEDHNELICTSCLVNNHKKCTHVVLITDKVKALCKKGDFQQLSTSLDTLLAQWCQKKDDLNERLKTLEKSYKNILKEINTLRKAINDSLDELEGTTIKELESLRSTMHSSIETDKEACAESINSMTGVQNDWQNINNKSETIQFVMYRKCLDQSKKLEEVLQKLKAKNELTLTFEPDTTIQKTLSALSGLGQIVSKERQSQNVESITQEAETSETKPKACETISSQNVHTVQTTPVDKAGPHEENKPSVLSHLSQVIKVQAAKEYSIRVKKDKETCCISGVCEIATGKVLISDSLNKRVKLLDHNYTVDAYCDMPGLPLSMCSIDSSLVAVALRFDGIHFIRLTNGQLTKDKTLQLEHDLSGLTYHQGNLYVTSGAALFHYTVDGRLVSKLYEVTAESIPSCAVSPDGERIYLVCYGPNQLVTLSKNGTVISIMKESSLDWGDQLVFHGLHVTEMGSLDSGDKLLLHGLHVTEMGQVLVCGFVSNKIIQVDRDGRQRLAEVVTEKDDVDRPIPVSVYYNKHTGTLIVGMLENDSIFVFITQ